MSQPAKLIAFLIEGPAGGIPGFQETVVAAASQSEMEAKIAEGAYLPGAEVRIVHPSEWDPPSLNEISDNEIGDKADVIFDRIMRYLVSNEVKVDGNDLSRGGTEIRNPVTGKVFFVFRHFSD